MVEELVEYASLMTTPERFKHIIAVRDFSLLLSRLHGVDPYKSEVSAITHDLFRDVPKDVLLKISKVWEIEIDEIERKHPILLHGKVAAEFLKRRFKFEDESVILAISYHTSGHPDMDEIGKVLMIADTVGYDRDFPGVERIRRISHENLERAFIEVLKNRIEYAVSTERFLLPKSVETWNKAVEVIW